MTDPALPPPRTVTQTVTDFSPGLDPAAAPLAEYLLLRYVVFEGGTWRQPSRAEATRMAAAVRDHHRTIVRPHDGMHGGGGIQA